MAKRKSKNKIPSKDIEYEISSGNVFQDFGYANPEEAKAKWDLALLIRSVIKDRELTQDMAAELMGIDQPKISKITRGILSEFTIERLMRYLVALGIDIEIKPKERTTVIPSIHVGQSNVKRLRV